MDGEHRDSLRRQVLTRSADGASPRENAARASVRLSAVYQKELQSPGDRLHLFLNKVILAVGAKVPSTFLPLPAPNGAASWVRGVKFWGKSGAVVLCLDDLNFRQPQFINHTPFSCPPLEQFLKSYADFFVPLFLKLRPRVRSLAKSLPRSFDDLFTYHTCIREVRNGSKKVSDARDRVDRLTDDHRSEVVLHILDLLTCAALGKPFSPKMSFTKLLHSYSTDQTSFLKAVTAWEELSGTLSVAFAGKAEKKSGSSKKEKVSTDEESIDFMNVEGLFFLSLDATDSVTSGSVTVDSGSGSDTQRYDFVSFSHFVDPVRALMELESNVNEEESPPENLFENDTDENLTVNQAKLKGALSALGNKKGEGRASFLARITRRPSLLARGLSLNRAGMEYESALARVDTSIFDRVDEMDDVQRANEYMKIRKHLDVVADAVVEFDQDLVDPEDDTGSPMSSFGVPAAFCFVPFPESGGSFLVRSRWNSSSFGLGLLEEDEFGVLYFTPGQRLLRIPDPEAFFVRAKPYFSLLAELYSLDRVSLSGAVPVPNGGIVPLFRSIAGSAPKDSSLLDEQQQYFAQLLALFLQEAGRYPDAERSRPTTHSLAEMRSSMAFVLRFIRNGLQEQSEEIEQDRNAIEKEIAKRISAAAKKYEKGKVQEAFTMFTNILNADPDNFMVCYNCGAIAEELDDLENAKKFFVKCLRLRRNHPDVLQRYGTILGKLGQDELSSEVLTAAAQERNRLGVPRITPLAQGLIPQVRREMHRTAFRQELPSTALRST